MLQGNIYYVIIFLLQLFIEQEELGIIFQIYPNVYYENLNFINE